MIFKAIVAGFIVLASAVSLEAQTAPSSKGSASEVFARTNKALVTIRTPSSQGSGVLVDSSGVIVTNLHVLNGETSAAVKVANGDVYDSVAVIDVDPRRDLAVLRIKGYNLPTVEIGDSDNLVVGDEVFAIGSGFGTIAVYRSMAQSGIAAVAIESSNTATCHR